MNVALGATQQACIRDGLLTSGDDLAQQLHLTATGVGFEWIRQHVPAADTTPAHRALALASDRVRRVADAVNEMSAPSMLEYFS